MHAIEHDGWRAELHLDYERRAGRTVLVRRRHAGPLVVQKPLYPEGDLTCHGIVLHPPGGIVGGDRLELTVRLGTHAAVLLTTPGAAKWYRSAGARACQRLNFHVGRDASLEWLPQPAIAFNRASARTATEVSVDDGGTFIGWELLCLGRTAAGERFDEGCMLTSLRVCRSGKPVWFERARIDGGSRLLDSPVGLAGQPVSGTLVAVTQSIDAATLAACRALAPAAGRGGVTRLPGVCVARYLGPSIEAGHDYFVRVWQILRPALLGRTAMPPRIWST